MFNFFKKKKVITEKPKNLKLITLCLAYEVANADNEIDSKAKLLQTNTITNNIELVNSVRKSYSTYSKRVFSLSLNIVLLRFCKMLIGLDEEKI